MKKIINKILGYKYYAILVDYMGYDSLSAELFSTKENAEAAAKELQKGRSQYTLHIVSFRTHRELSPEIIQRHVSYAKD